MAGPYSQIFRSKPVQTYAGLDLGALTNAFQTVRNRYDQGVQRYNALEQAFNAVDVGDNLSGQAIKDEAIGKANNYISSILKTGDFENAGLALGQAASDFAGNKELQSVLRGYNEHQIAREAALKNPGSIIEFSDYNTHNFRNEDGTVNPYVAKPEEVLDYTARKLDLIGTVKDLGGSLGLSRVETEGLEHFLKTGQWAGIDPKRGEEVFNQLADYYITSDRAGQQEFKRLTNANSLNDFAEGIGEDEARQQIKDSFQKLGSGRIGRTTQYNYMADPLEVARAKAGIGKTPLVTLSMAMAEELGRTGQTNIDSKVFENAYGDQIGVDQVRFNPASMTGMSPVEQGQVNSIVELRGLEKVLDMELDRFLTGLNDSNKTETGYEIPISNEKLNERRTEGSAFAVPMGGQFRTGEVQRPNKTFSTDKVNSVLNKLRTELNLPADASVDDIKKARTELLGKTKNLSTKQIEDAEKVGTYTEALGPGQFIPTQNPTEGNIQNYDMGNGKTSSFVKGTMAWDINTIHANLGTSDVSDLKDLGFKQLKTVGPDGERDVWGIESYMPFDGDLSSSAASIDKAAGFGDKGVSTGLMSANMRRKKQNYNNNTNAIVNQRFGTSNIQDITQQLYYGDSNALINDFDEILKAESIVDGKMDWTSYRDQRSQLNNYVQLVLSEILTANPNITDNNLKFALNMELQKLLEAQNQ